MKSMKMIMLMKIVIIKLLKNKMKNQKKTVSINNKIKFQIINHYMNLIMMNCNYIKKVNEI